jgi:hypothetical protein
MRLAGLATAPGKRGRRSSEGKMMAQAEWLYLVTPQTHGPVTAEALQALFSAGQISHETLIQKKGAEIWKLFGDVFLNSPPGSPPVSEAVWAQTVTAAAIFPPQAAASVMAARGRPSAKPHSWRRNLAGMLGAILGRRS